LRLRGREVTGVVIGSSYDRQRMKIRRNDTGQVMHCVKNKLELSPTRQLAEKSESAHDHGQEE
jgi:hypothetical protein